MQDLKFAEITILQILNYERVDVTVSDFSASEYENITKVK